MHLQVNTDDLKPIIDAAVEAALERIEPLRCHFGRTLLHSEPESAAILGVKPAHLGELRRTGKVPFQQLGSRVFYSNRDLLAIAGMDEP